MFSATARPRFAAASASRMRTTTTSTYLNALLPNNGGSERLRHRQRRRIGIQAACRPLLRRRSPFRPPPSISSTSRRRRRQSWELSIRDLRTPYVQQWNFGVEHSWKGLRIILPLCRRPYSRSGAGVLDMNQINVKRVGFLQDFINAPGTTRSSPTTRPETSALPTIRLYRRSCRSLAFDKLADAEPPFLTSPVPATPTTSTPAKSGRSGTYSRISVLPMRAQALAESGARRIRDVHDELQQLDV